MTSFDDLPAKLYRYRAAHGSFLEKEIAKLKDNQVWFSPINAQNDPFEANPNIIQSPFEEYKRFTHTISQIGKVEGDWLFKEFCVLFRTPKVPDEYWKNRNSEEFFYAQHVRAASKLADFISSKFNICCFSEEWDNPLMWAHYANSYSGVVLEFEKKAENNPLKLHIGKVATPKNKAEITSLEILASHFAVTLKEQWISSPEIWQNIGKALILTKSPQWEYEKEWRVFSGTIRSDYYTIPCYRLSKVIFGLRTPNEIKLKFHAHLGDKVQFLETEQHSAEYGLVQNHSHYGYHPQPLSTQ